MNITTLAELKKHSGPFFDRDTMAFFNSRVESGIYRTGEATGYIVTSEATRYIVTSEQAGDESRMYRIRKYEPSGFAPAPVHIDIVREFATREEAMHTARAWAKRDRSED